MPYTAGWDETAPVGGTTQAKTIDDLFRNLKRDIRERMDSVLGTGKWASDPVFTQSITVRIPWAAGAPQHSTQIASDGAYQTDPQFALLPMTGGTLDWVVPIVLPVGAVLKGVKARLHRASNIGITAQFTVRQIADDTTITELGPYAHSLNNLWQDVDSGTITLNEADGYHYALVNLQNGAGANYARLAGIKITYTRANGVGY